MADTHGHGDVDPEAAPMHHDIDERFSSFQIAAAAVMGIGALVLGVVFGIVFANT